MGSSDTSTPGVRWDLVAPWQAHGERLDYPSAAKIVKLINEMEAAHCVWVCLHN
jgi:hypothetical protein